MPAIVAILGAIVAAVVGVTLIAVLIVPLFKGLGYTFKGIGWLITHIFTFIFGMVGDVLRVVGSTIASIVFVPLVLGNIVIGRWSAAAHFGRGFQAELATIGHCFYRLAIGRPARLLLLSPLTEGLERRIPEAIAKAPGSDKPSKKTGQFEGYTIVGSLKGGGSGGKLFIADPSPQKVAAFARSGMPDVGQVVIKSFSIHDGSSLPQIIRESRALEAARKLQLILDHELTSERFFYVMPYVPGESLTIVTETYHAQSGAEGLDDSRLRSACGYVADLLATLDQYHRGGLWHKDVKPDNIIISDGEAHVVDLGLVTPLRSAMTLTTHGTEYFRDPELVRQALRGVKVHEVDGVKFDLYGAGAVLYSVVENSFPAHGGLSQLSKRCPESLKWIIRRSMADMHKRYPSARHMLADLRAVIDASDPFALKPADLPSMSGEDIGSYEPDPEPRREEPEVVFAAHAATPAPQRPAAQPAAAPAAAAAAAAGRPKLNVVDWWTGRYEVEAPRPAAPAAARVRPAARRPRPAGVEGRSAKEQLASARARVKAQQKRAHERMRARSKKRYSNGPNFGVAIAVLLFFGAIFGGAALIAATGGFGDRAASGVAESIDPLIDGADVSFSLAVDEPNGSLGLRMGLPEIEGPASDRTSLHVWNGSFVKRWTSDSIDPADVSQLVFVCNGAYDRVMLVAPYESGLPEDDEAEALDVIAGHLRAAGVDVLGRTINDRDQKYAAKIRKLIGVGDPATDAALRVEIRDWLADNKIDSLLWATPREPWSLVTNNDGLTERLRALMSHE